MHIKINLIVLLFLVAVSSVSDAGIVIGGSDLLSAGDHSQLEAWLGEGGVDLTNIFDRSAGDTAADFHAAVDGMGRTFTLIQLNNAGTTHTVGGYSPQSWNSSSSYNLSPTAADQTGFMFNLETGRLYEQIREYQTYNRFNYGPTFGGGHDLYIDNNLSGGYANIGHSYHDGNGQYGTTNYRNAFAGSYSSWSIDAIEVFTISPAVATPEPGTMAMFVSALGAVSFRRRKRA